MHILPQMHTQNEQNHNTPHHQTPHKNNRPTTTTTPTTTPHLLRDTITALGWTRLTHVHGQATTQAPHRLGTSPQTQWGTDEDMGRNTQRHTTLTQHKHKIHHMERPSRKQTPLEKQDWLQTPQKQWLKNHLISYPCQHLLEAQNQYSVVGFRKDEFRFCSCALLLLYRKITYCSSTVANKLYCWQHERNAMFFFSSTSTFKYCLFAPWIQESINLAWLD